MRCNDAKVIERLYSDYEEAQRLGHKVLGVFLQGSQNYNLDYESSDIDTKCIVLPNFEDICLNKKMVSTTHVLESGEHLDLKDIRKMIHNFKKQNINFLEILFTDYYVLNPEYYDLWMPLIDNKEAIAHYDVVTNMRATSGMCYEKFKALCKDTPAQHDEIVKYGWASKQLHHCKRLREFAERYANGVSFEECLISKNYDDLVEIKSRGHELYTLEEAVELADKYQSESLVICKEFELEFEDKNIINKKVEQLMTDTTVAILKKALKKDIMR